jgi:DNA-binding NtrC family response regulator
MAIEDSVFSLRGLVVDDDDATLLMLVRLFEHLGLGCAAAKSMGEAVDWMQKEHFAFLLTDLNMPGGSGLDLLAWAQRMMPALSTALMSGVISPEVRRTSTKFGAKALIEKPFTAADLHALLDTLDIPPAPHVSLKATSSFPLPQNTPSHE